MSRYLRFFGRLSLLLAFVDLAIVVMLAASTANILSLVVLAPALWALAGFFLSGILLLAFAEALDTLNSMDHWLRDIATQGLPDYKGQAAPPQRRSA